MHIIPSSAPVVLSSCLNQLFRGYLTQGIHFWCYVSGMMDIYENITHSFVFYMNVIDQLKENYVFFDINCNFVWCVVTYVSKGHL